MIDETGTTLGLWKDTRFLDLATVKQRCQSGPGPALGIDAPVLRMVEKTEGLTDDWSLMMRTVLDRLANVAGELAPQWHLKKHLGIMALVNHQGRRAFMEILEPRSAKVMKRQGTVMATMNDLERVHLGCGLRHVRSQPDGHLGLDQVPTSLTVNFGTDGLAQIEAWMVRVMVGRLASPGAKRQYTRIRL